MSIDTCVSMGLKLCVQTCSHVLAKGVLERINVHTKNFAIVQNKLAMTLKSFILTITGNAELSKEVLHKQLNFICQDSDGLHTEENSIYSGKNYGITMIK